MSSLPAARSWALFDAPANLTREKVGDTVTLLGCSIDDVFTWMKQKKFEPVGANSIPKPPFQYMGTRDHKLYLFSKSRFPSTVCLEIVEDPTLHLRLTIRRLKQFEILLWLIALNVVESITKSFFRPDQAALTLSLGAIVVAILWILDQSIKGTINSNSPFDKQKVEELLSLIEVFQESLVGKEALPSASVRAR